MDGQLGDQQSVDSTGRQRGVKARRRRGALDRVPRRVDALRPALLGRGQRVGDLGELQLLCLVGRVDQRQPAPLLRRQQRLQRLVAVPQVDGKTTVMRELAAHGVGFPGRKLAQGRPVVRPHQHGRDAGRTRIEADSLGVFRGESPDEAEVPGRQRRQVARLGEPADPGVRLAALARRLAVEVVAAAPRVRVQEKEGLVLLRQPLEQRHQHDVLEYVAEIAGMKSVAVVHGL